LMGQQQRTTPQTSLLACGRAKLTTSYDSIKKQSC